MSQSEKRETPKTDSSSFASILANVAKLRDQESGTSTREQPKAPETVSGKRPHPENLHSTASDKNRPQKESIRTFPAAQKPKEIIIRGADRQDRLQDAARYNSLRKQTFKSIQVNRAQNGNPLLSSLKQVSFEFNSKVKDVDYLINSHCIVLFLSLKYHKLHPEYIYNRLKKVTYNPHTKQISRILMVLVDIGNSSDAVRELNKLCVLNELNLVLAWTFQQCADYLTFLKQCELNIGKSLIKGANKNDDVNNDTNYYQRVIDVLTSVKSINKTDSVKLLSKFGTFRNLCEEANEDNLQDVQGMGQTKIEQLLKVINDPFIYK